MEVLSTNLIIKKKLFSDARDVDDHRLTRPLDYSYDFDFTLELKFMGEVVPFNLSTNSSVFDHDLYLGLTGLLEGHFGLTRAEANEIFDAEEHAVYNAVQDAFVDAIYQQPWITMTPSEAFAGV